MKFKREDYFSKVMQYLALIIIVFFFIQVILANLDFSIDHHILNMDELITFDGIQRILHPHDVKDFLFQVADGNDLRYGRVLWYLSALVSFIPEYVWGDQGQIVATRVFNAIILFVSYIVLNFTFVKSAFYRSLCILFLLSLPHTVYYATMPKPEPLQLLFISIFLYEYTKNKANISFHYIFLGMALGTKISTLVILPYFFVGIFLFYANFSKGIKSNFNTNIIFRLILQYLKAIFYIIIGLIISLPILAKGEINRWLYFTIHNTGHGADNSSITWKNWLQYVYNDWIDINGFVLLLFSIISLFFCVHFIYEEHKKANQFWGFYAKPIIGIILSLLFFFPIILLVKRVWGIYLHPAAVLFLIGFFSLISHFRTSNQSKKYLAILSIIIAVFFTNALMSNIKQLEIFGQRSLEENHIKNEKAYREIKVALESIYEKRHSVLKVYYDPFLYRLDSNEKYEISLFWGYFKSWNTKPDIIIFTDYHYYITIPVPTNIHYNDAILAKELNEKHIAKQNGQCKEKPCYSLYKKGDIYFILTRI